MFNNDDKKMSILGKNGRGQARRGRQRKSWAQFYGFSHCLVLAKNSIMKAENYPLTARFHMLAGILFL